MYIIFLQLQGHLFICLRNRLEYLLPPEVEHFLGPQDEVVDLDWLGHIELPLELEFVDLRLIPDALEVVRACVETRDEPLAEHLRILGIRFHDFFGCFSLLRARGLDALDGPGPNALESQPEQTSRVK